MSKEREEIKKKLNENMIEMENGFQLEFVIKEGNVTRVGFYS